MSSATKQINEARRKLTQRLSEAGAVTIYGEVSAVDDAARTCTIDVDGVPYTDVRLYSVENPDLKGFVFLPKVGSQVLVSRIGASNELYLSMFSEVDKVILTIGDKVEAMMDEKELTYKNDEVDLRITGDKVELNADKIEFNGGDNKGLIKIQELTDKINSLVDTFNNHTHTLMSGTVAVAGSATSQSNPAPITVPAITSKAQKLQKVDYENDKITH